MIDIKKEPVPKGTGSFCFNNSQKNAYSTTSATEPR